MLQSSASYAQQILHVCSSGLFNGIFTTCMGTGGHYITMFPADWSISTSHDHFALQFLRWKMLWNLSISRRAHSGYAYTPFESRHNLERNSEFTHYLWRSPPAVLCAAPSAPVAPVPSHWPAAWESTQLPWQAHTIMSVEKTETIIRSHRT